MNWNIHPMAFLEFFVVIAFGVGWWVLERYANKAGGGRPGKHDGTIDSAVGDVSQGDDRQGDDGHGDGRQGDDSPSGEATGREDAGRKDPERQV